MINPCRTCGRVGRALASCTVGRSSTWFESRPGRTKTSKIGTFFSLPTRSAYRSRETLQCGCNLRRSPVVLPLVFSSSKQLRQRPSACGREMDDLFNSLNKISVLAIVEGTRRTIVVLLLCVQCSQLRCVRTSRRCSRVLIWSSRTLNTYFCYFYILYFLYIYYISSPFWSSRTLNTYFWRHNFKLVLYSVASYITMQCRFHKQYGLVTTKLFINFMQWIFEVWFLPGWPGFNAKFQKFGMWFGIRKCCLARTSEFGMFLAFSNGAGRKKCCLAIF